MKIIMLLVIFFCLGAFFIISQNNLSLDKSENIDKFVSLYKNWIKKILHNFENFSGYVIKMKWLPE